MCDDDTIKGFIVENGTEGRGILGKILGDPENFYKGGYLESKRGQFGKVNIHQAKDPELFKRVTEYWNPSYNGTGTARPSKEYVYNVLHRNPEPDDKGRMFVWCDENKHTKLMRFKQKAFKSLKVVRDNCGEFTNYDIVFTKQGTGNETFFTAMKADIGTQHNRVGELSAAEKEYEQYDLDFITRLASAGYVLKNLRRTIERIDAVVGTNYVAELEKQAAVEEEEYNKRKEQGGSYGDPVPAATGPSMSNSVSGTQAAAPVADRVPLTASGEPTPPPAPQGSPAPPRVRQAVTSPTAQTMVECGHCHQLIPDGLTVCPKCQGVLMSECDTCHKPFSVFAKVCPHCGQVYSDNSQ
jgi:hypothetical protein